MRTSRAFKTARSVEATDAMPPDLRRCVHEFGHAIVYACMEAGVSNPRHIEKLVYEIWKGARQPTQVVNARRNRTIELLDWMLIQSGSNINADRLLWALHQGSLTVVPIEPTNRMVEASMLAIANMGVLTKANKHRIRLRAAIRQARDRMMLEAAE